ncbi:hypothetical protein [Streptomyces sp. NPDC020298]|uniref:hypothetical protein n=1 Tax=unclassified Streptomyces TaxID=2593676 RepID=UPI0033E15363
MPQEEQGTRRAAQQPALLDEDTPQAKELAGWLKDLTRGLTLRDLAADPRLKYGRTTWGEFLKGRKLIPSWLLEDLVKALVRERRAREHHREHGLKLWHAAAETSVGPQGPAAPGPPSSTVTELQLRLDDARKGQLQAQEALLGLNRLIYMLLHVIANLQNDCSTLEREGGDARAQLLDYQHRLAQSEARLERAQRDRENAEELRIEALRQAEKDRRALERLQAAERQQQAPHDGTDDHAGDTSWTMPGRSPDLWEYDRLLEQADAQLDAHEAQMDAAREQLGIQPAEPTSSATVLTGEVVRTTSADTADKPMTGENPVRDGVTGTADSPIRSFPLPDSTWWDHDGPEWRQYDPKWAGEHPVRERGPQDDADTYQQYRDEAKTPVSEVHQHPDAENTVPVPVVLPLTEASAEPGQHTREIGAATSAAPDATDKDTATSAPAEAKPSLRRNRVLGGILLALGLGLGGLAKYIGHGPILAPFIFGAVLFGVVAFLMPIDLFSPLPKGKDGEGGDDDNYFEPMMG